MLQGVVVPSRQMRSAVWPRRRVGMPSGQRPGTARTTRARRPARRGRRSCPSSCPPALRAASRAVPRSTGRPSGRPPRSSMMAKGLTAVSTMARYIAGVGSSPTANSTCSPGSIRRITSSICVVTIGQIATVQNPRTSSVAGLPRDRQRGGRPPAGAQGRPPRAQHVGAEIGQPAPAERHRHVHLGEQAAQHVLDARLAAEPEPVDVRPPEQHRGGAERHRLHHVGAGAHAGVEQHGDRAVDGLEHGRQRVERGDGAVDLAAAVVRHDDAVDARVDRGPGVVGVEDALEHDRQRVRSRSQARSSHVRVGSPNMPAHRSTLSPARVLGQGGVEGGVGEVVGDAGALEERQVGGVEVGRPPAQHEGVDRDDERRVAGGLGPADERRRDLAVGRPVELVPAGPGAGRLGHRLQGVGGGGRLGEDEARGGAARADASSPSGCTIACTPIGASTTGAGMAVPSTVVDRSRRPTSRSIRGTIASRSKAARLARAVEPPPALPAT